MTRTFWYVRQLRDESITPDLTTLRQYTTVHGLPQPNGDDILIDRGTQGFVPLNRRTAGKHLLEYMPLVLYQGCTPALVCTHLPQLFGSVHEAVTLLRDWLAAGVRVHLAAQGGHAFELSTDAGQFFLKALEGAIEIQNATRRDKNLEAVQRLRASNRNLGTPPYGWRTAPDGKHLEAHPEEQRIIQLILAAVHEHMGTQGIADRLNELRVPCRGKRWHRSTIRRVLRIQKEHSTP